MMKTDMACPSHWARMALLGYGATIASFLGAIHWGLVMREGLAQPVPSLLWGVVPACWAGLHCCWGMHRDLCWWRLCCGAALRWIESCIRATDYRPGCRCDCG